MGLDLIYAPHCDGLKLCQAHITFYLPSSANMKMKRKRRSRSDKMDDMAFVKATTRLRREDQYL